MELKDLVVYTKTRNISVLSTYWAMYEARHPLLLKMFREWGCFMCPYHAMRYSKKFKLFILNELEGGN